MPDDAPSDACPCLAAAVRAASRRLTLIYDELMAPSGLRVTQYNLLSELERRADTPPTVGELAAILVMERSALGQTLRPLERDGLVALGRDARDGRRRPIEVTRAGRNAVAQAQPYWARAHAGIERALGAAATAELRATIRAIAADPTLPAAFEPLSGPKRPQAPPPTPKPRTPS